ncbi:MAG: hypothetical protein PVG89_02520 [Gammaproteobacteria bacterium]
MNTEFDLPSNPDIDALLDGKAIAHSLGHRVMHGVYQILAY